MLIIMTVLIEYGGAGRHLVALDRPSITLALKLSFALQIVCPLTTSFSKLGVLCLFYRIFGQSSRAYRMCIKATFAFVVVIMIAQILIPFLNCRPFNHTWHPESQGSCAIPALSLWRYLGIPNVVTTLIIVTLPVPALAKLNVSRPVRLGLIVVFGICILGIVAAIMRFQSFLAVTNFRDITYENVKPLCWTIAESGIYLVAGIMPTLRPLLMRVFKDTIFHRLVATGSSAKVSGSWGNKRISRMKRAEQGRSAGSKQDASVSVVSAEGVALVQTEAPKTNGPGPDWI